MNGLQFGGTLGDVRPNMTVVHVTTPPGVDTCSRRHVHKGLAGFSGAFIGHLQLEVSGERADAKEVTVVRDEWRSLLCKSASHTHTRCQVTQKLVLELGDDRRWLPPPQRRRGGEGDEEPARARLLNFATVREARHDACDACCAFAISNFMIKWTGSVGTRRTTGRGVLSLRSQRRRTRRTADGTLVSNGHCS